MKWYQLLSSKINNLNNTVNNSTVRVSETTLKSQINSISFFLTSFCNGWINMESLIADRLINETIASEAKQQSMIYQNLK